MDGIIDGGIERTAIAAVSSEQISMRHSPWTPPTIQAMALAAMELETRVDASV